MEGGVTITELYIFNQDDKLLTILTPENGLLTALFRDELNKTSDTPLQFTVDAQAEYSQRHDLRSGMLTQVASSFVGVIDRTTEQDETVNVSPSQFVKEENRVVFKDREGRLREFVIKEIDDINNIDGPETTATCIPSFVEELNNKVVVDRRFVDKEAQEALDAALQNTRFNGVVDLSLGKMTTNFYYISSLEAVFKIREVWGGDIRDIVYLSDDETRIERREIRLLPRLGADNGLRFESDHNIEEIQRTILSYPYTALFGRGASLQIEDEEGELTGGHTRYIDFADVEWKKSAGDPVDKPLGQKWVGDPDALQKYGYEKDCELLHLEGIFSNQDYEDKAELLYATWEHLQKVKHPEVNYKLSVDLLDKPVDLGDTAIAIDREFARPIEVQNRIIAMEYDLVDIENTTVVEIGEFLNLRDNIREDVEDLRDKVNRPERPIDENSYPNKKPSKPTNVEAVGGYKHIQLRWDYTDEVFVKHYEVYGSQVADFVPDEQQLLFRGQVSAFGHEVNTDETWYYYVRAVNYHDVGSEYSNQASASTLRIPLTETEFEESFNDAVDTAQSAFDRASENVTEIDNLALRVGSLANPNLISHDPNSWESVVTFHSCPEINLKSNNAYTFSDYSTNDAEHIKIFLTFQPSGRIEELSPYTKGYKLSAEDDTSVTVLVQADDTKFSDKLGTDYRFRLEQGEEATEWTDADTFGQFSILNDAINLRVQKNDVINQINVSDEGILIDGARNHITGETLIDNAVIKDAHIFELSGEKILAHSIVSDKLNVDSLSAITANLGIVEAGYLISQNGMSEFSLNTGELIFGYSFNQIKVDSDGLSTNERGTMTSLLNKYGHRFYESGTLVGTIGTSQWENRPSYKGLVFHMANGASYMAWAHDDNNDNTYTTKLSWFKDNKVKLRGFYFNDYVQFNYDIRFSTRIGDRKS